MTTAQRTLALEDLADIVDCEHRTIPRAREGETYAYSVGTASVRNGRLDLSKAKPVSREAFDGWTRRGRPRYGDIILAREAPIGDAAMVPESQRVCLGQRTVLIRPDEQRILPRFLHLYLLSPGVQQWFQSRATGSTVLHVNVADVRIVPIKDLPPLSEQQRIADILEDHLSRIDAARHELNNGIGRVRALHKSVLTSVIPEPRSYPESWKRATVSEAGHVELGRQRHPEWHHGPNMRPYLRVANVFEDRLDIRDIKEMHWPDSTFERFRLQPGDVLLNEGQSPEFLGRPALYRGEPKEVAFTNSLIRFQAGEDVLPEFALLVFRRHMHAGRFAREARITTNIAHLSAARLKPIEFPIPSLDEQRRLVEFANTQIDNAMQLQDGIKAALTRGGALRRSLLNAAFSGQLTGRPSDIERVGEVAGV